jgi:hypothetical protein
MDNELLTEKYSDRLDGVLNCYDGVTLHGSLQPFCYAEGMTNYLYNHQVRIFDYAQFAEPLRDELRAHAEAVATEAGLSIEFIRQRNFRKEDRIAALVRARGTQPGLVHIFSAMEPCASYKPWHDKQTHHTFLRYTDGKCLHYYFYFIDEALGLCYLRVPTWCPFRLQFYTNGHAWIAAQLTQRGIAYTLHDNAFGHIADYQAANELAAQLEIVALHARLDAIAQRYCPVIHRLQLSVQWSLWQVEYAPDLVFKQSADLQSFYPLLLETLIHTVKPDDIATFLGRKLHGNYQGEMGNRLNQRVLGTRIKHTMQPVSIKLYDKFGFILRIEVTVNDVSFFKHHREVQHRDGSRELKDAPMKKTIYSLPALREQLLAANQRYLKFISAIEIPQVGVQRLNQLSQTKTENEHTYKGFNLFAAEDAALCRLLLRGEFAISGLSNRTLRPLLPGKNTGQVSRLLKRLRVHGVLKKVGHCYKYYLTEFGRQVTTMALKLRELVVIPAFAHPAVA